MTRTVPQTTQQSIQPGPRPVRLVSPVVVLCGLAAAANLAIWSAAPRATAQPGASGGSAAPQVTAPQVAEPNGPFLNVKEPPFNAAGDGVTDDTEAIQRAWDAAKESGARVVLPAGEYRISLRGDKADGYRPALHFSASGTSKERQPMLEGATRGVTLKVDFPEDAPRTLPVVLVDKGTLTDNPRGMSFRNLRLVNASADPPLDWREPYDFRGTGLRVVDGWTGPLLENFQISGFYIGLHMDSAYHCEVSGGEVRNCNFGLYLFGTPNGNSFRSIALLRIRHAATNTEGLRENTFPQGRVGACVYAGGGTISGGHFENVNTELCGVAGYCFHSAPQSLTVASMRSESVFAPVWAYGPLAPYYTSGCTFITPCIDCDSLGAPAVYLHRARGYTLLNPYFYQRHNEDGSRVAIEMTSASRGNLVINPGDDGSGTTGDLADDVIDAGTGNEVQWLGAEPSKE